MEEILRTIVCTEDDEKELDFVLSDDRDCVTINLDGEHIYSGDWHNNLKELFERALNIWSRGE